MTELAATVGALLAPLVMRAAWLRLKRDVAPANRSLVLALRRATRSPWPWLVAAAVAAIEFARGSNGDTQSSGLDGVHLILAGIVGSGFATFALVPLPRPSRTHPAEARWPSRAFGITALVAGAFWGVLVVSLAVGPHTCEAPIKTEGAVAQLVLGLPPVALLLTAGVLGVRARGAADRSPLVNQLLWIPALGFVIPWFDVLLGTYSC